MAGAAGPVWRVGQPLPPAREEFVVPGYFLLRYQPFLV